MQINLKNKNILITGGTGSFGKAVTLKLLKKYSPRKVIIYSRDELKQHQMSNDIKFQKYHRNLRFFIGDIRDKDRLRLALNDTDFVIHAAALKQILAAEYNPMEAIKTNIIGAQNLIDACMDVSKPIKVIALSTDKAVDPINLYGATKLVSDKLFVAANNISAKNKTSFSIVRYGNVIGSRGSVIPVFKQQIINKEKYLTVTDKKMTRFFITLDQATDFVLKSFNFMTGGEIFIPKMPSISILELAKTMLQKNQKIKITGIRAGEKLHEILSSSQSNQKVYDMKNFFIIYPDLKFFTPNNKIIKKKSNKIIKNFKYSSDKNKFLSNTQIKKLLK